MLQLRPACMRDCTGQLWTGKSLARVPWAGVATWERYGIDNGKQGRQSFLADYAQAGAGSGHSC